MDSELLDLATIVGCVYRKYSQFWKGMVKWTSHGLQRWPDSCAPPKQYFLLPIVIQSAGLDGPLVISSRACLFSSWSPLPSPTATARLPSLSVHFLLLLSGAYSRYLRVNRTEIACLDYSFLSLFMFVILTSGHQMISFSICISLVNAPVIFYWRGPKVYSL